MAPAAPHLAVALVARAADVSAIPLALVAPGRQASGASAGVALALPAHAAVAPVAPAAAIGLVHWARAA